MTRTDKVLAITSVIMAWVIAFLIMTIACTPSAPTAKNPPVSEQESHTIRYLAQSDNQVVAGHVWLIEVDGKKYVAVYKCGVAEHESNGK